MKDLKFSEYPLRIPSEKKISAKMGALVELLKTCKTAKEASAVMKKWNKYGSQLGTDISVIYVLYSCNTDNPKYKKAQEKVDEISPVISNYANQFERILLEAPYRKELEGIYGEYLFKKYEIDLKCFDEKIIPDLIEENKLSSQYDAVMGGAKIEFRGGVYNLSQIGKFTQDADRQTRKEAAQAMDKWMGENEQVIGDIYDKLVHLRDGIAKKLGYKRYTELAYFRLGRTDYNPEMVEGYRKQIYEDGTSVYYFVKGLFRKDRLIDYIENFVMFDNGKKLSKIIAKNHQYIGVNNLMTSLNNRKELDGKCHFKI